MRTSLSLLALLAIAFIVGASSHDVDAEFAEWCLKYDKTYPDEESWQTAKETFAKNLLWIDLLNTNKLGGPDVVFAMNEFGDLTPEEFADKMLMKPSSENLGEFLTGEWREGHIAPTLPPSFSLPESWNWTAMGAVTPVKNQGTVGTCWAFSTTGNIEGQWFLAGHPLVSLSEEQLVNCDTHDCGVFGGWPYRAYEYVISAGGIESEADFPYCAGTGACYPCMADHNRTFCGPPPEYCNTICHVDPAKFVAKILNWTAISTNETEIAFELVSRGPLSALMDADLLQFYHSGVYEPPDWLCDPTSLDHAVLLVGFGVESELFGIEKKPYWLVKNSWGESFGIDGYFKIYRGAGTCGINTAVTTSLVN